MGSRVDRTAEELGVPTSTVSDWLAKARAAERSAFDDWEVVGASVNASGGISRRLKPKDQTPFLAPARTDGWVAPKRPKVNKNKPRNYAIVNDLHAPFTDRGWLAAVCAYLAAEQPTDGFFNGDIADFPDVSKYADKREWAADCQTCIDAGYDVMRAMIDASPKTRWKFHRGNHEDRLPKYVEAMASPLWGIRPAHAPEWDEWHSFKNLFRLDELGVECADARYPDDDTAINNHLLVTHGESTKPGAGNSVRAAMVKHEDSQAQGHDHRIALFYETRWGADKQPHVRMGMSTGCGCTIDASGLGYAPKPDWQNGFGVIHTWPDGMFSGELGIYVKGTLLIGDKRFG